MAAVRPQAKAHHVSHMNPKVRTRIVKVAKTTYVRDRRSRSIASSARWRASTRMTTPEHAETRTSPAKAATDRRSANQGRGRQNDTHEQRAHAGQQQQLVDN